MGDWKTVGAAVGVGEEPDSVHFTEEHAVFRPPCVIITVVVIRSDAITERQIFHGGIYRGGEFLFLHGGVLEVSHHD